MKSFVQFIMVGAIALSVVSAQGSDNRYSLILRGTCKSADESGDIVSSRHSSRAILAECAEQQDPPVSARSLALVYDVADGVAYIVDRATGNEVCEVFSFETKSALSNAGGTQWELLVNLNDTTVSEEDGGAICSLGLNFNSLGQISRFHIRGRYHLVYENDESEQPIVCSGSFTTGRKFTPGVRRR